MWDFDIACKDVVLCHPTCCPELELNSAAKALQATLQMFSQSVLSLLVHQAQQCCDAGADQITLVINLRESSFDWWLTCSLGFGTVQSQNPCLQPRQVVRTGQLVVKLVLKRQALIDERNQKDQR